MFIVMMRGCIWPQKYLVISQEWLKRVLDLSSPAPVSNTHLVVFGVFTSCAPKVLSKSMTLILACTLIDFLNHFDVSHFFRSFDFCYPFVHPVLVHHRTQRAFEMQRFLRAGYSIEEVPSLLEKWSISRAEIFVVIVGDSQET